MIYPASNFDDQRMINIVFPCLISRILYHVSLHFWGETAVKFYAPVLLYLNYTQVSGIGFYVSFIISRTMYVVPMEIA